MSVPSQISDGNWNSLQYETINLSYPFADKGDGESVEAELTYTQDKSAYSTPNLGNSITIPGINQRAYLINPGTPTDIGSNLYKFTRTYATLPVKRTEGSTVALTVPLIGKNVGDTRFSVESFTITYAADIVYEYFTKMPKPLIALNIFSLFGVIYVIKGSEGNVVGLPPGGPYLAENSEVGVYKGKIYYRRSIYAIISTAGVFAQ